MGKIGLLGGTFDPIHNTHISMGMIAKDALALDKVIYIPAGVVPHKDTCSTSPRDRYEMTKTAVAALDGFEVSDYETNKQTPSYSVETVAYFAGEYPRDELFFILGEDSLAYVDKWYRANELLAMCSFAVIGRGGFELDIEAKIRALEAEFSTHVYYIKSAETDIASRNIRKMLENGENVEEMIPDSVMAYIRERGLYKIDEER